MVLSRQVMGINNTILFIMLIVSFVVMNISFFYLQKNNEKQQYMMLENNALLSQKNELLSWHYQTLNQFFEGIKHMQIEINNHLQVIWLLARNPKNQDFEKYSKQMHGINQQLTRMFVTNNNMIDAVLWNHVLKASKKNIVLELQIELPSEHDMNVLDLGFALDFLLEMLIRKKELHRETAYMKVTCQAGEKDYTMAIHPQADTLHWDELKDIRTMELGNDSWELDGILQILDKYKGNAYYQWDTAFVIQFPRQDQ